MPGPELVSQVEEFGEALPLVLLGDHARHSDVDLSAQASHVFVDLGAIDDAVDGQHVEERNREDIQSHEQVNAVEDGQDDHDGAVDDVSVVRDRVDRRPPVQLTVNHEWHGEASALIEVEEVLELVLLLLFVDALLVEALLGRSLLVVLGHVKAGIIGRRLAVVVDGIRSEGFFLLLWSRFLVFLVMFALLELFVSFFLFFGGHSLDAVLRIVDSEVRVLVFVLEEPFVVDFIEFLFFVCCFELLFEVKREID